MSEHQPAANTREAEVMRYIEARGGVLNVRDDQDSIEQRIADGYASEVFPSRESVSSCLSRLEARGCIQVVRGRQPRTGQHNRRVAVKLLLPAPPAPGELRTPRSDRDTVRDGEAPHLQFDPKEMSMDPQWAFLDDILERLEKRDDDQDWVAEVERLEGRVALLEEQRATAVQQLDDTRRTLVEQQAGLHEVVTQRDKVAKLAALLNEEVTGLKRKLDDAKQKLDDATAQVNTLQQGKIEWTKAQQADLKQLKHILAGANLAPHITLRMQEVLDRMIGRST